MFEASNLNRLSAGKHHRFGSEKVISDRHEWRKQDIDQICLQRTALNPSTRKIKPYSTFFGKKDDYDTFQKFSKTLNEFSGGEKPKNHHLQNMKL